MFGNRMAKPVVLCSTPPQIESLRRFGILPPPNALRFPSFCCKASSAIQCNNMSSSTRIFIKGLPQSTSEGRLMKAFSEFGDVTQVKVPIDKESGQSLGYAYIGFDKEESAKSAVKEMNGKFFDGRFIYVTTAKPVSSKSQKRPTAYKF
ncbi:glycine-rich RNA-binding protein 4, mitochondrial [Lotus japonicus]|uniref:glycine-rich RNA-binding protein 4, mitochondrial n=1 Tax=Lotus japonicus TaxID=34305 RepID=UPI00258F3744|nr:glycine-rich RNA-binding protein 4, mitochondrial [Lotus japonicus]